MSIFGNEAVDVLAKRAAEEVPLGDREKWMSGGGVRQWTKQKKKEYLEGAGGRRDISRER